MERMALVTPIKSGKTESLRRYVAELQGPRAEVDAEFMRRFGIHRQTVWLQHTPDGDVAIVYQEFEDPELVRKSLEELKTSDDPHAAWKRQSYQEMYDLGQDGEPAQLTELLADRTF
jgi:hypothetical protein